jgi:hypothetical protein
MIATKPKFSALLEAYAIAPLFGAADWISHSVYDTDTDSAVK